MLHEVGPALQENGIDAGSFEELAEIAAKSLNGKRNLHIVCGPLTSGGTGLQELNFEIFNAAIRALERRGYQVFDQVPYEFGLRRLAQKWEEEGNVGYCWPILHVFYARIFETGAFGHGWFIPGRRGSTGAEYEFGKLAAARCNLREFSRAEIRTFLLESQCSETRADRIMCLVPRDE